MCTSKHVCWAECLLFCMSSVAGMSDCACVYVVVFNAKCSESGHSWQSHVTSQLLFSDFLAYVDLHQSVSDCICSHSTK